jgi:septal ring factor EnvC (AmiA/AmiB activator)
MVAELPEQVPATAAVLAFPDTADRRLRRALTQLNRALDEQRDAVAAFKAQLAALNGAVAGLGANAEALRGALDEAAAETAFAEARSRALLARTGWLEGLARR